MHKFFMNSSSNFESPKWFVECQREGAEDILRRCSEGDRGNVLMRLGRNGNYAISARTVDKQGVAKISHFVISKTPHGKYSLDVDNKPPPMSCLSDVMSYYLKNSWYTKSKPVDYRPNSGKPRSISMRETVEKPNRDRSEYKFPRPNTQEYVNIERLEDQDQDDYMRPDSDRISGLPSGMLTDKPGYFNKEQVDPRRLTKQLSVPVDTCVGADGYIQYDPDPNHVPSYVNISEGISSRNGPNNMYAQMGHNKAAGDYVNVDQSLAERRSVKLRKSNTIDCGDPEAPQQFAPPVPRSKPR